MCASAHFSQDRRTGRACRERFTGASPLPSTLTTAHLVVVLGEAVFSGVGGSHAALRRAHRTDSMPGCATCNTRPSVQRHAAAIAQCPLPGAPLPCLPHCHAHPPLPCLRIPVALDPVLQLEAVAAGRVAELAPLQRGRNGRAEQGGLLFASTRATADHSRAAAALLHCNSRHHCAPKSAAGNPPRR